MKVGAAGTRAANVLAALLVSSALRYVSSRPTVLGLLALHTAGEIESNEVRDGVATAPARAEEVVQNRSEAFVGLQRS